MNITGHKAAMQNRGGGMVQNELGMGSTRDSRAQEAIRMKDEQLRILTDQNSHLLKSLKKVKILYL